VLGLYSLTGPVNRGGESNYEAAEEQTPAGQTPPQIEPRFYGQNKSVTCEAIANIHYREGGYGEDDIARCDLRAQRQMALFTVVIAGLTFIGLVVLWQTLRATQATLTEAENATKAAIETTAVTRRIGEAQVRAYLAIIDGWWEMDSEGQFEVTAVIKNVGQSPANFVKMRFEAIFYAKSGAVAQKLKSRHKEWRGEIVQPIPASQFQEGTAKAPLNREAVDAFANGGQVALEIDISYGDVFKTKPYPSVKFSIKTRQTGELTGSFVLAQPRN
jgi:hypothetical protein